MNTNRDAPAPGPMRLSLGQLMLWLMTTCVALAHEKWRLSSVEPDRSLFLLYANIHAVVYAPLTGAGLAGLVLWMWRRVRGGPPFPTEPGHWLLVILGAEYVIYGGWEFFNEWFGPDELANYLPTWFTFAEIALFQGFIVGLILVAATRWSINAFWRAAFVAMTVDQLSHVLHTTLVTAFTSGVWFMNELAWSIGFRVVYSLPALFVLLATVADRRAGRPHDFLHWAGVTVVVVQAAIAWPDFIVWRYLFR